MIVTLLIKINKHILHGIILVHIKYIKRRSRALILNFIDVFSEFDSHKILRKENIIIPLALHFKSNPQLSININNIQMDLYNPKSLSINRIKRLQATKCLLGQPQLISITRIKIHTQFLSKKKMSSTQQYFVSGINFITTAHISSYISGQIKSKFKQSKESQYHAMVYIYDIFQKKDIQVSIKIPGSMEIRAYELNGEPTVFNDQIYQRGYYSSILRNLYLTQYHSTLTISDSIKQYQTFKSFVLEFVRFTASKQLVYDISTLKFSYNRNYYGQFNPALELLLRYLIKGHHWALIDSMKPQLIKYYPNREYILRIEVMHERSQYEEIISMTASDILKNKLDKSIMGIVKQFQLLSILKLGKQNEGENLLSSVVKSGIINGQLWVKILEGVHDIIEQKQKVLKYINVGSLLYKIDPLEALKKQIYPRPLLQTNAFNIALDTPKISDHPHFCFEFNEFFLKKYVKFNQIKDIQSNSKYKTSTQLLSLLEKYKRPVHPLQTLLIQLQNDVGWQKLLEIRSEIFFIQSDSDIYHQHYMNPSSDTNQQSGLFFSKSIKLGQSQDNSNISYNEQISLCNIESEMSEKNSENSESLGQVQVAKKESKFVYEEISEILPFSRRVPISDTLPSQNKQIKLIATELLQQIFKDTYQSLNAQITVEKWSDKILAQRVHCFSKERKLILGMILYEKALLHKKLHRYRKFEESLKKTLKISQNLILNICCYYELNRYYIQQNFTKGVQMCLIEIIKALYSVGITQYDIIPQWAQKSLQLLIQRQGNNLWKSSIGPLKDIVKIWKQRSI